MSMEAGRRRAGGFTLVELMIVVLIIGILSAIGIPSYRAYVIRVKRTDAKVELTNMAQFLERCFTRYNVYNNAACVTGLPKDTLDSTYRISGVITANNFDLTATPLGAQGDDTACGNFMLDEVGLQAVSGSKPANECW